MLQMLVDRARAHAEDLADIAIDLAAGDPIEHLGLADGEPEGGGQRARLGRAGALSHQQRGAGVVADQARQAQAPAVHDDGQGVRFALGQPGPRRRGQTPLRIQPGAQPLARCGRLPAHLPDQVDRQHRVSGGIDRLLPADHLSCIAHMRRDARQHFRRLDRFREVVHAAGLEARERVACLAKPRHEDDRDVGSPRVALQPPAGLEAVEAGHDGVEQDHIGQQLRDAVERGVAVGRHQHAIADGIECFVQHRQVLRRVVDDQHDPGALLTVEFRGDRVHPFTSSSARA